MRPLGENAMPLGRPLRLGDQTHLALGGDVIDAVEIQLARVGLIAESRIGEINLAVLAHHDVVGSVEALALPLLRQHLDLALLVDANHAACLALATVEPALRVEGVTVGVARIFAKDAGLLLAGRELRILFAGTSLNSRNPSRDQTGPSVN